MIRYVAAEPLVEYLTHVVGDLVARPLDETGDDCPGVGVGSDRFTCPQNGARREAGREVVKAHHLPRGVLELQQLPRALRPTRLERREIQQARVRALA